MAPCLGSADDFVVAEGFFLILGAAIFRQLSLQMQSGRVHVAAVVCSIEDLGG